jgi:dTDP-4-amino-4,6-dideoxygalactose transaminase/predicted SAM-dependent methyltransferase
MQQMELQEPNKARRIHSAIRGNENGRDCDFVTELEQNDSPSIENHSGFTRPLLRQITSRIPSRSRSAYILSRLFFESVPAAVRTGITTRFGRSWSCFCPVCEDRVPRFSPLPEFYSRQMALHGSDLKISDFETCNANGYQCPHCGATDRDRLYAIYLLSALPKSFARQANFKLLDIAPSAPLSNFIRRKFTIRYRTADRFMKNVDDRVDIADMHIYPAGSFDAFICSHVLEHVQDDVKAISELWRVLKPGGWGMTMVPINSTLQEVRENASCTTENERWKHFGQGDHVRVYSREGFVARLQKVGFVVRLLQQQDFENENFTRCGLSPTSVLYVVEKPIADIILKSQDEVSRAANISLDIVPKEHNEHESKPETPHEVKQPTPPRPTPEPNPRLLALIRGTPRFPKPLHVGRPNIGDKAQLTKRFEEIIDCRWFTNDGPVVQQFERKIAEITGVKNCVSICNATVALEIAIRALELRGEVIVPSYTFVATAHALQWQEITPVFADINPRTLNLDPACLERLVTPRTTGIIGVHLWGRPCDTNAIEQFARKHRLKALYDAAHAFGCSHEGKMIGNFGECEILSFHATKFINSFEGGAIVTNNDALAEKIRLMRNFGFAGFDRVTYLGTNGKMTEICAAMGLTSLESMDKVIRTNRENYEIYQNELEGVRGLTVLRYNPAEKSNYHYIVLEVDPFGSPLNRDELVDVLHADNILARKYFWPGCHRMEPYRSLFPNASLLLPNTESKSAQVMVLPTGQCVSRQDIIAICNILKSALEQSREVRRILERKNAALSHQSS